MYTNPTKVELDKTIQADFNEGWTLVRTITAIEAPVWTPGVLANSFRSGCFGVRSRFIAVRFFSDVAAAAPVVAIAAESRPGPGIASDLNHIPWSLPEVALAGTLTMSGMTCVNLNPITNEATAATTWNACSAFVAGVGHPTEHCTVIPAAGAAAFEVLFMLDAFGRNLFYPYVTNLDTATSLIVAMKRIE